MKSHEVILFMRRVAAVVVVVGRESAVDEDNVFELVIVVMLPSGWYTPVSHVGAR